MPIAEITLLTKLVQARQFAAYAAAEIEAGRTKSGVVDLLQVLFGDRGLMRGLRQRRLLQNDASYDDLVGRLAAGFEEVIGREFAASEVDIGIVTRATEAGLARLKTSSGTGTDHTTATLIRQTAILGGHMMDRAAYDALDRVFQKRALQWVFRLKEGSRDTFSGRIRRLEQEEDVTK